MCTSGGANTSEDYLPSAGQLPRKLLNRLPSTPEYRQGARPQNCGRLSGCEYQAGASRLADTCTQAGSVPNPHANLLSAPQPLISEYRRQQKPVSKAAMSVGALWLN